MHPRSSLLVAALLALTTGLRITAEEKPDQPAAAAPLEVSIAAAQREFTNAVPVFEVTLRNTGNEDMMVNLGMMLANGKKLQPDAIRLILIDAEGHSRELHLVGVPGVAGRVDDYLIPLRVGSAHSLRLSLDDYWCPTEKLRIPLKRGEYRVCAQLTSKGVRIMDVWTGTIQSEAATFRVGGKD